MKKIILKNKEIMQNWKDLNQKANKKDYLTNLDKYMITIKNI